MARSINMLLMLVGCVILATAVLAEDSVSKKIEMQFFEHDGRDVLVFECMDKELCPAVESTMNTGQGHIYNNKVTATYDPESEQMGTVSGLYFATYPKKVTEVSSVKVGDTSLILRGRWSLDTQGNDLPQQELAIVGGTKGYAGAYGTLKYTKVGSKTWLVQALFYIDLSKVPTQA
ncbi:protein MpDIR64 [Marchantia polymorpha subsp. ruderalis]|uniref:Dirigent protein n=2 Tax=Marchantia polymorpha TaxID=3197 RepID=A0AAF6B492_MARPO|nr:hypothetical protein MARPO_1035s0001 [Marchantia polymorpha]BBN06826.1 hypothetical protein Mp_3g24210 [Marchantia polymorpha subsp. ruderalis]|eukprot:PTQ26542.1 hypothetical protein MARPO_1035s0001 [Marchantia polymorpha]